MGSLKCDLSHITVHTVNNHTHTLRGDGNAGRQPSGNRYVRRHTKNRACVCIHRRHAHVAGAETQVQENQFVKQRLPGKLESPK